MDLLQVLEHYQRQIGGVICITWGVLAFRLGRIRLEDTQYFLAGRIAKFLGVIVCAVGIYLLLVMK